MSSEFEVKDLGALQYFLGLEITRSKRVIFISHRKYVLDLLTDTGLLGARPINTPPIEANHGLNDQDGRPLIDAGRYQRLVGKLIYLALTWPNIAFTAGVVSQFMHTLRTTHLEATFHIMRYLKSTPGRGLLYFNIGHVKIEVYTNVD